MREKSAGEMYMTRDEMMSRLHQIDVGVSLVALTSEGH